MTIIQLDQAPRHDLALLLGGQAIEMSLWWQPVSLAWYVSVTREGTPLTIGRQVTPWQRLITQAGFSGDIVAIGREGRALTPLARNAWAETHQLVYITPEENARV